MTRRLFALLAVAAFAAAVTANPVPKDKDDKKEDPGKPFEFPNLEAKSWKKLDNGMKVWDVKEGTGDAVKAGAKVKVNYVGWLTNGKKFDSSIDRNEPISFGLNQVIKGWQEGVPGMKPGGVRRLIIPPEMAYGKRGAPGAIPPDSTLVFVIEYLGPGE